MIVLLLISGTLSAQIDDRFQDGLNGFWEGTVYDGEGFALYDFNAFLFNKEAYVIDISSFLITLGVMLKIKDGQLITHTDVYEWDFRTEMHRYTNSFDGRVITYEPRKSLEVDLGGDSILEAVYKYPYDKLSSNKDVSGKWETDFWKADPDGASLQRRVSYDSFKISKDKKVTGITRHFCLITGSMRDIIAKDSFFLTNFKSEPLALSCKSQGRKKGLAVLVETQQGAFCSRKKLHFLSRNQELFQYAAIAQNCWVSNPISKQRGMLQ